MRIRFDDVAQWFENVITRQVSFEDADRWAWSIIQAEDTGTLEYEPRSDKDRIWRGVTYLYGVDMQTAPGVYLHSIEDVKEKFVLL